MSAGPASFMTARTSAKSRLINPGALIRSMIPSTARSSTSSTAPNASTTDASEASTSPTRSFGTTIRASTFSASSAAAASATRARCDPSNPNGLVTTAIVSAP